MNGWNQIFNTVELINKFILCQICDLGQTSYTLLKNYKTILKELLRNKILGIHFSFANWYQLLT